MVIVVGGCIVVCLFGMNVSLFMVNMVLGLDVSVGWEGEVGWGGGVILLVLILIVLC